MRALASTRNEEMNSWLRQMVRFVAVLVMLVATATATAQTAQGSRSRSATKKPDHRIVTLKTKDGVKLRAFYFPSAKSEDEKGKEAITVMVVHEWRGQASPYYKLVSALRTAGCAVLIPDYRGHGGSREYTDAQGKVKNFNLSTMSKRDVENIVAYDLEKAKAFLKDENNEEKLNLNALVVIGVQEGCVMAAHWAKRDWQWPSIGQVKQGQDVKALVFISPEKLVKGVAIDQAITDRNLYSLPIMILAGSASDQGDEAERIAKRLGNYKKRINRGEISGLEVALPKTNLSGAKLVNSSNAVIKAITTFVTSQVPIDDEENRWVERR